MAYRGIIFLSTLKSNILSGFLHSSPQFGENVGLGVQAVGLNIRFALYQQFQHQQGFLLFLEAGVVLNHRIGTDVFGQDQTAGTTDASSSRANYSDSIHVCTDIFKAGVEPCASFADRFFHITHLADVQGGVKRALFRLRQTPELFLVELVESDNEYIFFSP